MMGTFSSCVSDCSGYGLQSLVSWKDARMAPGTTTGEEETVQDIETVAIDHEVTESRKSSDTSNPQTT